MVIISIVCWVLKVLPRSVAFMISSYQEISKYIVRGPIIQEKLPELQIRIFRWKPWVFRIVDLTYKAEGGDEWK